MVIIVAGLMHSLSHSQSDKVISCEIWSPYSRAA